VREVLYDCCFLIYILEYRFIFNRDFGLIILMEFVKKEEIKKVIVLGSGALKIGEAGEFDYSGSQALKAMKEEGIETVIVNPNIATIQTSKDFADKIYFLPVTPDFVEQVIEKEKPDGVLLGFGGQTALNCGVELADKGVFEKFNVKVLGTSVETIRNSEDRDLFVKEMEKINVIVPRSIAVTGVEDALDAARKIGYPIITRPAFTLGGKGNMIAMNEEEMRDIAKKAFSHSSQVLIEEYLKNWKEIEYEIVRDCYGNKTIICEMENFDPMGIHTGESIVVAPIQTLSEEQNRKLREVSFRVVEGLDIRGECNIQFAFNAKTDEYRVIEVNARLSRSSALASKATGYALAFVAAKLSLGYSLKELGKEKKDAFFEPQIKHIALKFPRWDLQKFSKVVKVIGTEMKSVGEVMALGKSMEEIFQKAVRMLDVGLNGIVCNKFNFENLEEVLEKPTDKRMFAIVQALERGFSIEKIEMLTGIDKFFIGKIKNIVDIEVEIKNYNLENFSVELLERAKGAGFSDKQIGLLIGVDDESVRKRRIELKIIPAVQRIDTLDENADYLYLTYGAKEDVVEAGKNQIIVLGGGAYRIGSSVEFDWCAVNSVFALKREGYGTIMINYNPETVSTDYDICDRLYFDELSFERVADIYEKENPNGVVLSVGGQIPNNIALRCAKFGMNILGTSAYNIDRAENRKKFSGLLDELGIEQPEWRELIDEREAVEFAEQVGYPVLVRPSYVLSGAAMKVVFSDDELREYLEDDSVISNEFPVVVSKFIENAKEIEIDAVANNGKIVIYAISEHIENAGVHSGDATMVFPPRKTYMSTVRQMEKIAEKLAFALHINGPFNIQFIAKKNKVKVIELNLRASRSFPFVSKISKVNFIDLAIKSMLGKQVGYYGGMEPGYYGVKAPQFSFSRLRGADPVLGVEMASTGEVACLSYDFDDALLKSLRTVGYSIPSSNILLSIGGDEQKIKFLNSAIILKNFGYNIFATEHTKEFLDKNGVGCGLLHKVGSGMEPNILDYLTDKKIDLFINVSNGVSKEVLEDEYVIRRAAIDFNIPLITNLQLANTFIEAIARRKGVKPEILDWDAYD